MSRLGTFTINGKEHDLDDLTLDEMESLEELAGGTAFSELNFGSAKTMKAIATVLLRRDNPTITAEEIGRVRLIDFLPPDEEVPETGPPSDLAESESQPNGSAPDAAGVQDSVASIAG